MRARVRAGGGAAELEQNEQELRIHLFVQGMHHHWEITIYYTRVVRSCIAV
jgi:hypothetical protein